MFEFEKQFDVLSGERITLKIIEKHPGNEVLIPFYYYDIYENKSNQPIGKISIRMGCNDQSYYNGHIGYEIDEAYRGHRYSLESALLVLQVAKFHQMAFIYVTCRETNQSSRKIIELLGGNLLEVATIPTSYFAWHEGIEPHCIYQVNL